MAPCGPDAGRDGFALPGARPSPWPEVRTGLRRRHGGVCGGVEGRRSGRTRRNDDRELLQTLQKSRVRVRILGCGTSTGVPKIGDDWGKCAHNEPRNYRLRSSIVVESGNARVLVECGPDLRQQLLTTQIGRVDAVVVTHDHGDHVHGIDELRPLAQAIDRPVPVFSDEATLASLRQRFAYAFAQTEFYRPIVEGRVLTGKEYFGEATLRIAKQPHGTMTTLGLRFDEGERSLSYAIDFNELTNDMMRLYEGVDVWIA